MPRRARAGAGSGEAADETIWFDLRERNGATEFLGYTTTVAEAQIVTMVADGTETETAEAGAEGGPSSPTRHRSMPSPADR